MICRWFILSLLVATFGHFANAQGDTDIDELIDQVFTMAPPSPSTPANTQDRNAEENAGGSETSNGGGTTGDCECVPYYLCLNGTLITDGTGIIDIRMNDNAECENYLDVCCSKDQVTDKPILPEPQKVAGCGQRNPEGIGYRITGNVDEASFGEFPWMVAILREESVEGNPQKLNVYQCGGALIHPQVVLTAAHCVIKSAGKQFKIRAGEWDTQTKNEIYPHQDRRVREIISHPQFHQGALFYDVALLILEEPIELTENVDIVCLPPAGIVPDVTRCLASGWGKNLFGKEGKYQVILKKLELPIVPHTACQTALRKTRLGKHFQLHATFVCAGGEPGKDTCKGDGGSPLVCPIPGKNNKYYQAGIVAWGIGCGEDQTPGVYGNVAQFRSWIDEQMKRHSFNMEYSY